MRPARHRYAQALAGGARKILGEPILAIAMLVFAIGFNLWLYRVEPSAKVDPNDNTFQFALVYRTNQIWDYANKKCSGNILTFPVCHFSYLADHWVPNWNEGYNLPFYYSHIPQILIVGSWRLLHSLFLIHYSLFTYYHIVIYLLLCLFPLSVFLALLITGLSPITAGFGALLASQISTDGFYGLDPPSFLWRGYGLSSQLFAMVWLPLTIAYCYRAFTNKRFLAPAIVFLILTTAGHLGIGIIAFLSLIPLSAAAPIVAFMKQESIKEIMKSVKQNAVTLGIVAASAIFFLSYWIVPALLADTFHNFSFWDPVWKFNSYGAKEVITRLGNGALFDFGRLPIYTGLVIIGIFVLLSGEASGLAFMFIFFLLMYFGRTAWGNLINLIPAMREFHLSRFIVGVHLAGMFLAPIGLTWLWERVTTAISHLIRIPIKFITIIIFIIIMVFVFPAIYGQTIRYAKYNDTLIAQANGNYAKQSADANSLVGALQELQKTAPGRVFAGRGGSWGKDFQIAETTMTMYLGNFALPTVLWMPETWSPNADTEQYFREDKAEDYALYNIRYVATPANLPKTTIQPFWKLIKENPSWRLYSIDLSSLGDVSDVSPGYFTVGVRPAIVASDKYSFTNVIRLWIQSSDPKNGLYPQLSFDTKNFPKNVGLPNFKMLDEVTFQVPASTRDESTRGGPDGSTHNVFAEPPRYLPPSPAEASAKAGIPPITLTSQTNDADMIFSARVSVPENCTECLVILKQSYHPNWRVTVDGEPAESIIVFPFFIGIPVTPGDHTIVASYEPSWLKIALVWISLITLISLLLWFLRRKTGD